MPGTLRWLRETSVPSMYVAPPSGCPPQRGPARNSVPCAVDDFGDLQVERVNADVTDFRADPNGPEPPENDRRWRGRGLDR